MVQDLAWRGEKAISFKGQFEAALPELNRAVRELQALEQDLAQHLKRLGAA